MWTVSILLLVASSKAVLGDAIFELQLIKFHNPAGKGSNGKCCESVFSWTCSASDPSDCDPHLKICVDQPYSTECTDSTARLTGEYSNTNSFRFGETFNSGTKNPMEFLMIPWQSGVKITIKVEDRDGGVGGDHDSMGKTSVIFEENLSTADSKEWYDITFTYTYQTITAKARAYCHPHYYGANCTDYCSPKDDNTNGHYTCAGDGAKVCRGNYYGESCKVYCQEMHTTAGHSTCTQEGSTRCDEGWIGEQCTEDINECLNATDNPCYPNGNCNNTNGSYACACDEAYTGTDCQDLRSYCDENSCGNHTALCNNTLGGFVCVCEEGWIGDTCEVEITPCTNSPCHHNGTCAVVNDTYECNCTELWEGTNCDTEKPDPCANSPCLNNGVCTVMGNNYKCICVREWEGRECQTRSIKMEDDYTIYLDGNLEKEYYDALTAGIQRLLANLNITDADIRTTITHPDSKTTRVDIFVESSHPNINGSLKKLFYPVTEEEKAEVNNNLPLHLTDRETLPVKVKSDPWVKRNWYVVLIIVIVLIATLCAIVVVLHILRKRRLERMKKSGFDSDRSVMESVPDAALGFDNSLYFEVNQPDRVSGLSEKY